MTLLDGIRVLEVSLLAPDAVGMHLADLGAQVIKIEEPPRGDYVREVGFAMVDGVSTLHRRWNRGKRSLGLDLRQPEGHAVFEDLVTRSDAVVEGLRPGGLARRGFGYDRLRALNPRIVLASVSGYGQSGPYRDLASHGVAYDAYAGLAPPRSLPNGFPTVAPHTPVGIHAGALFGAFGIAAALVHAQRTGSGCHLDVSQADAAAWWNGPVIEHDEERGTDDRDTPGDSSTAGPLDESVRYQYYATADGRYVLFMATEAKFWETFCTAAGRQDLFERFPPRRHSDHDRGNLELRAELVALFATRTQREWVDLFLDADVPGVPVYAGGGVRNDPHFAARARWLDRSRHAMPILGTPLRIEGGDLPEPSPAPTVGQHSEEVLRDVLHYEPDRIQQLRQTGVVA